MTACPVQQAGSVELLFYDELGAEDRARVEVHLAACTECRRAFHDLKVIDAALAARPIVSAPPEGDWTRFMARLADTISAEQAAAPPRIVPFHAPRPATVRSYAAYVTMAALLVLVTMSVAYLARSTREVPEGTRTTRVPVPVAVPPAAMPARSMDAGFAALSEQHFERSKLVVLGLANKTPGSADDWDYERQLATALLSDTRLYRQAAEGRGLTQLARVMGDLELVLLQTSLADEPEPETLEQIQRLIQKRDLVTKMNVVKVAAGL